MHLYLPQGYRHPQRTSKEQLLDLLGQLEARLQAPPEGFEQRTVWSIALNIQALIKDLLKIESEVSALIILRSLWERTIDICYLAENIHNNPSQVSNYLANSLVSGFKVSLKSMKLGAESSYIESSEIKTLVKQNFSLWLGYPEHCLASLKQFLGEDYKRFFDLMQQYLESKVDYPTREIEALTQLIDIFKKYKEWREARNGFNNFTREVIPQLPLSDIDRQMNATDLLNMHEVVYEMGNSTVHSTSALTHRLSVEIDQSLYADAIVMLSMVNWALNQAFSHLITQEAIV